MSDKLKVMLTTEGTYPFHQGGVSTWCDMLVHNLKDVEYVIYSVVMNPFVTQKFSLSNQASLIKLPLWGTEEPCEHLTTPFSQVFLSKKRTLDSVVKSEFIPIFDDLIDELITSDKDPQKLGNTLLDLHNYFKKYEYKMSFKSEHTWQAYKEKILKLTANKRNGFSDPNVYSLVQSLGWIYRFLNVLNTPVPDVHVTHSAAAAFCGIPCVLAKLERGTPYLLTEHGVYLREQYLSLAQRKYPSFLNTFLIKMIHSVTSLNYYYADQVSPVCHYNTRWEKRFGVKENDIKVIYNGVDKKIFSPDEGLKKRNQPTVVAVARIDPIKDIETLIRAAAIVREQVSDVKFIVYGSVSVPEYYELCLELRSKMKLEDTFTFAGHTSDVPAAYKTGDIIALSSISEAFPYSVVEAMMTSKPVIATDVGGIKEALGDTGIIVSPRSPEEFADAILKLLRNPGLCETLGEEARERALNYFTIDRVMSLHLKSYINLVLGDRKTIISDTSWIDRSKKQRLLMEKGFVLHECGFYLEAISMLRLALQESLDSPTAPVILTYIARAYNSLGEYDKAFIELEKAEAIMMLVKIKQIA
jgi:glycosyltransferase involved in cell wall biosynthesis